MSIWERIAAQFGKPTGIPGALAGRIMATRSSNLERIAWAVSLLELQKTDRVLEVGFGPGVALRMMSHIVTEGGIVGIDHSAIMLRQASRRNRDALGNGRMTLLLGSVSRLPSSGVAVNKVLDINSFQFWQTPLEDLLRIKSLMAPGGLIALVNQPRKPGADDTDTDMAGEKIADYAEMAGFVDISVQKRMMKPIPTVCVLGRNAYSPSS